MTSETMIEFVGITSVGGFAFGFNKHLGIEGEFEFRA